MKKEVIDIIDYTIQDGLEDNELILMYSIKNKIKELPLDFETEYQLQQFKEIQKDHFDGDGKAYRNVIPVHLCEHMLKLINQLEKELI